MVKHCSFGTCKSDSRYQDKLMGAKFIPFPKPKSDLQKCLRWISLCRRPHDQLNVDKITKHTTTYICSKHFISIDGPSDDYPDPCDAQTGELRRSRRKIVYMSHQSNELTDFSTSGSLEPPPHRDSALHYDVACQTEEELFSSMEMFSLASRIRQLEEENERLRKEIDSKVKEVAAEVADGSCQTERDTPFTPDDVSKSKIKNLFEFYTGLTFSRFLMLFAFLFPCKDTNPIVYEEKRKEAQMDRFPLSQQVFMYLCRLRNGLHVKDLAFRFNVKVQTVSTVVNGVAKYMYLRLGSLSYWPHRNVIVDNMPESFKIEFPTCLAILDCTELKTEKPSSLKQQSQCYSDYKSSNTLKGLVVCDPRGSVLFVSDLYSGSISDNDIMEQCGFYDFLRHLKEKEFILSNDALMADKGFLIEKELALLDLRLNIPL
ncbi:uncharacterized protein LOC134245632 isoform X2 [Saccostrea cucullata]|uniref:uncharacterized protein LOC134245632 isoform X2 n=1 Tax=Saccostrea cuccullata TaxID=36930 RepID=UPI002ECFD47C